MQADLEKRLEAEGSQRYVTELRGTITQVKRARDGVYMGDRNQQKMMYKMQKTMEGMATKLEAAEKATSAAWAMLSTEEGTNRA